MSEKTWALTETGNVFHSFYPDGEAECRKNMKVGTAQKLRTRGAAQQAVDTTRVGFRMCKRCVLLDDEYNTRIEASMEPVNPYDQVCEGVVTEEGEVPSSVPGDEAPVVEVDMDAAHAEALKMDLMETLAAWAGAPIGSMWVPKPGTGFYTQGVDDVTVTRVWVSQNMEHVWVDYDRHFKLGPKRLPFIIQTDAPVEIFKRYYEPRAEL